MATEHEHSLLTDVARSIGSTLGTVAATLESVTHSAPKRRSHKPTRSASLKSRVRRAEAAAKRKAKSVSRKVNSSTSAARKKLKGAKAKSKRATRRVTAKKASGRKRSSRR
jgi:hypothetical protein